MSLPADLRAQIEAILGASIERAEALGQSFGARLERISTAGSRFALKWSPQPLPSALAAEARGLRLLGAAGAIRAPAVIAVVDPPPAGGCAFLLIEWLEGRAGPDTAALGAQLAELHRRSAPAYGLDHDNYIGGSPQRNGWLADWPQFFAERRLRPQIELAAAAGRLSPGRRRGLDRLLERVGDLLADVERRPALLHGDLWAGNVVAADASGAPGLVDPAVFYGDREAELAFTELFGGFGPRFYAAYREAWPLEAGYRDRVDLYNLYHLLNHLNLFGEGYGPQVDALIRRY